MYPIVGAPTETPSTRDFWDRPSVVYPPLERWINDATSGNATRSTATGYYMNEAAMTSNYVVQQLTHKDYGTDHKGMYLEGEAVAKIYNAGGYNSSYAYALSASTIDSVYARLAGSPGWDGAIRTNETRSITFSTTTATSKACINAFIDGKVLKIFFFDSTFSITAAGALSVRLDSSSSQITTTATGASVYQYSLNTDENILRFDSKPFGAFTGLSTNPTSSVTDVEKRFYDYFNTLTSRTNGVVQFDLQEPQTQRIIASIRYDAAIGFVITGGRNFVQYNGAQVASLIFRNVQFGNRAIVLPDTNTSAWVERFSPLMVATITKLHPVILDHMDIPEVAQDHSRVREIKMRHDLNEMKEAVVLLRTQVDQNQASIIAGVLGGGMSGIGGAISDHNNRKWQSGENQLDRDLNWNTANLTDKRFREMQQSQFGHDQTMQSGQHTHEGRMAQLRADLEQQNYAANQNVNFDMRVRAAGATAPINQLAQSRAEPPRRPLRGAVSTESTA